MRVVRNRLRDSEVAGRKSPAPQFPAVFKDGCTVITRVVFGKDSMLFDGRSGRGPQEYFQLDDASLARNVAPDAMTHLFRADIAAKPFLKDWCQDFRELLLMAQQNKTWQGGIFGNGCTRAGLGGLL